MIEPRRPISDRPWTNGALRPRSKPCTITPRDFGRNFERNSFGECHRNRIGQRASVNTTSSTDRRMNTNKANEIELQLLIGECHRYMKDVEVKQEELQKHQQDVISNRESALFDIAVTRKAIVDILDEKFNRFERQVGDTYDTELRLVNYHLEAIQLLKETYKAIHRKLEYPSAVGTITVDDVATIRDNLERNALNGHKCLNYNIPKKPATITFDREHDDLCNILPSNAFVDNLQMSRAPQSSKRHGKKQNKGNNTQISHKTNGLLKCTLQNVAKFWLFFHTALLLALLAIPCHERKPAFRTGDPLSLNLTKLLERSPEISLQLIDNNIPIYCFFLLEIVDNVWCLSRDINYNRIRVYSSKRNEMILTIETIKYKGMYELNCYIAGLTYCGNSVIVSNHHCDFVHNNTRTLALGLVAINKNGTVVDLPIASGRFVDALTSHRNKLYAVQKDNLSNTFINVYSKTYNAWVKEYAIPTQYPYIHSIQVSDRELYFEVHSGINVYLFDEKLRMYSERDAEFVSTVRLKTGVFSLKYPTLCQVDSLAMCLCWFENSTMAELWFGAQRPRISQHGKRYL